MGEDPVGHAKCCDAQKLDIRPKSNREKKVASLLKEHPDLDRRQDPKTRKVSYRLKLAA